MHQASHLFVNGNHRGENGTGGGSNFPVLAAFWEVEAERLEH